MLNEHIIGRGCENNGYLFKLVNSILFGSLLIVITACGTYPVPLSSRWSIGAAGAKTEEIDIRDLPLDDYPLLTKFRSVRYIYLNNYIGSGTTDSNLSALAEVGFTNLECIMLLNCWRVTDEGIHALVRISSLKELALEGTGITDSALEIAATKMHLTGINIANCSRITLKGLRSLANSETLRDLGFSLNDVTEAEVLSLIASFKKVGRLEIVDPQSKLDKGKIQTKGADRGIQIVIRRTGALQDLGLAGSRLNNKSKGSTLHNSQNESVSPK
jgi:hypothetical protein